MVTNNRWQMPTVGGRPLFCEHHIIMGGAAKAPWVRFLGPCMPELKKSNRHISAKRVNVSRRKGAVAARRNESAMGMLRTVRPDRAQFVQTNHINPVGTVNTVLVQVGVVKKNPPEVIRQRDVGIEVQPPAVILPTRHSRIERGTFVEASAILAKQIGLHANGTMLLSNLLCTAVLVAGDHDHRVQMRVVQSEGDVQEIVKSDACRDRFKPERFGGVRR